MLSNEHVEIIRSMKRRLDTMENDGDMFGQGFNHAIDRVCKLLEAEPPSGAESGEEKDAREWAMWFSINHLPNADLKTVSERAGYITQALLAFKPAESSIPTDRLLGELVQRRHRPSEQAFIESFLRKAIGPVESAKTVPLEMLIAVRQDLPVCATRDQMQEIAARYGYTVSEDKEEGR